MADTQKFIDDLITFIAEAEQPKSVTNEIVARVMNFLNTGYKDLLDNRADVATEQAQRKAADTALQETIDALQTALETVSATADAANTAAETNKASIDTLLGDNASAAIDNFNEVITFLSGVKDDASLTALLDEMNTNISTLVCEVADLETESEVQADRLDTLDKAVKVSTIDEIDNLIFGGFYLLTSDTNAEEGKLIVSHKLDPKSRPPRLKGDLVQYLFCNDGIKMRRGTFSTQNSFVSTTTTWEPWHVVDELGEKIPKEHVKVTCRFCDNQFRGCSNGAVVYVEIFNNNGYPIMSMHQKIIADVNGQVEFDVPYGFKYSIYSRYNQMSASFQFVYTAFKETREIELWNLKIGVGWLVSMIFTHYESGTYNSYAPVVLSHYSEYGEADDELSDADYYLTDTDDHEVWNGEYYDKGVVIATEDTCFVIPTIPAINKISLYSGAGFVPDIPLLINPYDRVADEDNWYDFITSDISGNVNTEKIFSHCRNSPAAEKVRCDFSYVVCQVFIPSYCQALLIAENYKALNSIFEEANEYGEEFVLIPDYELNKNGNTMEQWWTSTPYDLNRFTGLAIKDRPDFYGHYPSQNDSMLRPIASLDLNDEGISC